LPLAGSGSTGARNHLAQEHPNPIANEVRKNNIGKDRYNKSNKHPREFRSKDDVLDGVDDGIHIVYVICKIHM